MDRATVEQEAHKRLKAFREIAQENGYDVNPELVLSSSMKTTGGRAWGHRKIELHAGLLMQDSSREEMLHHTLGHELAHIICSKYPELTKDDYKMVGGTMRHLAHGPGFKRTCRMLGVNDDRCHSMDTSSFVNHSHVTVYCGCGTLKITKKRRTLMVRGKKYRCRECKQLLTLTPKGETTHVGEIRVAAQTSKSTLTSPTTTGSKRERAEEIYNQLRSRCTRGEIIVAFMDQLDMSKAGASTYYANVKKKLG